MMKRDIAALAGEFDLLVCGGGIYGAWTAYDAALRGLKVALVEQADWASATSSASSKLIHGGLRYLETYDFKLVRKALKERQRLLRIAPYRVWPLRFGVPVYDDSRNGMWKLKAGLTLYDLLAGLPDESLRHHHFDEVQFAQRFSCLSDVGLKGGFTYGDAQTDDARFVLELVAGAIELGAVCVNYAKLLEWSEEGGKVVGGQVRDEVSGATIRVSAKQCVSTLGRWAVTSDTSKAWCRLSKGIHLVMPALPMQEAILLTAKEDGRVFFVIPWYGRTVLGTTDTDYQGEIAPLRVDEAEIRYLLAAANHYLKSPWGRADVIGSYAGLRVMQQSDADSPSEVSRDWSLKTEANGLHHSIGGKLTSAREDASQIVDVVCVALNMEVKCASGERNLAWKPQSDYVAWVAARLQFARRLGIDSDSAQWLVRRHGKNTEQILRNIENNPNWAERVMSDVPLLKADLLFCAENEMVVSLRDLLRRRMPLMILADINEPTLFRLGEWVAPILGWDAKKVAGEVSECLNNPSQDKGLAE